MKRGSTVKRETKDQLVLERRMVTRQHILELDRTRCIGCQVCKLACPQGAIQLAPAVLEDGELKTAPLVNLEADRCNFCGECVVLCPFNALRLTVNGAPQVPVVEYGTFPTLVKEIAVTVEQCRPDCGLACQEACPTQCIKATTEQGPDGETVRILDVMVDRERCIYCVECAAACPRHAIAVTKPWQGRLLLDAARCPAGCRACADTCPTGALRMQDGQLVADERFCLYCGVCQEVCPATEGRGALGVQRQRILHAEVKSGAWSHALERLISIKAQREELEIQAQARRHEAMRFLPGSLVMSDE